MGMDQTLVTRFLKKAVVSGVEEEMGACTEGKTDKSKLKGCASDSAKNVIARTMGRDASDVKDEEVVKFVNDATVERVKKEMSACVESAGNANEKLKCRTEKVKKAMAKGLGKLEEEMDQTLVTRFLKKAVVSGVEEEMGACTEGKTD